MVSPAHSSRLAAAASTALLAVLLSACEQSGTGGPKPQTATPKATTSKSGIPMVLIPAGEFTMGGDAGEDDERPARKVKVSAFYMDVHEVTQEDYVALLGKNPSKFYDARNPIASARNPVERMSWTFATRYCNLRSLKEGLEPCYDRATPACNFEASGYRLPTEAEWEYACRAGTTTRYSFGNEAGRLGDAAWFEGNSGKKTHPVGEKRPNPWGLCDMHGNVREWCHDRYGEEAYASSPDADPRGPAEGDERVLRGGGWRSSADACRSAARHSRPPGLADVCFGYEEFGFRCVRRAE